MVDLEKEIKKGNSKATLGSGVALTNEELEKVRASLGEIIRVYVDYWDSYDEDGFGPQYCNHDPEDIILEGLLIREEYDCPYLFNVIGYKNEAMTREFRERVNKDEFSTYFVLGAQQYKEILSRFEHERHIESLDFCIPTLYSRPYATWNPAWIAKIEDENGKVIYFRQIKCGDLHPETNVDVLVRHGNINHFLNVTYKRDGFKFVVP